MSNHLERFGTDQDPTILVEVTEPSELFCFRIVLGGVLVVLHARSAVDLIHKLSIALCDWQVASTREILRERGYNL